MKKILKYTVYIFLALVFAAFVVRIWVFDASTVFTDIVPTENAKTAYAQNLEITTHELIQNIADDGNSRGYALVYIPESGELQITMKYNLSIYKKASVPTDSELQFKLYDTETEKEYYAVYYQRDVKGNYGYARVVFEGVWFSESADIEIVMCNEDYSEDFSCYKVHAAKQEFESYKLSKEEIALLGQ